MAQRGGARPGAGRPKGSKNKVTAEARASIAELARQYAPDAIKTLHEIACDRDAADAARVSAANSILDRAYGKPVQATELSGPDGGAIQVDGVRARDVLADRIASIAPAGDASGYTGQPD